MTTEKIISSSTEKSFSLSETMLLAVVPAIAYYFSYTYERGYFQAFGLPLDMVRVELTTILSFTAAILTLAIFMFNISNAIIPYFGDEENRSSQPLIKYIWSRMPVLFLAFIYIYIYDFRNTGWIYFGAILLLIILIDILPVLLSRKKEVSFLEQLNIDIFSGYKGKHLVTTIRKKYGVSAIYFLVCIILGNGISHSMGEAEATRKTKFLVPFTNKELLVAKIVEDKALCISIDNLTGKIKSGFVIINISQNNEIAFDVKNVDRIK
jgi:hypothetical protein